MTVELEVSLTAEIANAAQPLIRASSATPSGTTRRNFNKSALIASLGSLATAVVPAPAHSAPPAQARGAAWYGRDASKSGHLDFVNRRSYVNGTEVASGASFASFLTTNGTLSFNADGLDMSSSGSTVMAAGALQAFLSRATGTLRITVRNPGASNSTLLSPSGDGHHNRIGYTPGNNTWASEEASVKSGSTGPEHVVVISWGPSQNAIAASGGAGAASVGGRGGLHLGATAFQIGRSRFGDRVFNGSIVSIEWWNDDAARSKNTIQLMSAGTNVPMTYKPTGTFTLQREFNDNATTPLLASDGGIFYPYFTYFGGPSQPDGPAGWRWFNDEMQVYTSANYTPAPVDPFSYANGRLRITANPVPAQYAGTSPKPYVSGALSTAKGSKDLSPSARVGTPGHEQKYGYWEARVKVPRSKGIWAAFWLTGGTVPGQRGFGEIDIFECVDDGPNYIHQNIHDWSFGVNGTHTSDSWKATVPFDYGADFHTYGLLWTPNEIVWYIDGRETHRASAAKVQVFRDHCGPLHTIFNIAIGGRWPGSPNQTTVWPAVMEIDYLRVYSL